MSALTRAALAADLETHAFGAPASASLTPRRLGAEAEFIPIETSTWRRCPLEGDCPAALLPFIRRYGGRQGWAETRTPKGTPCFTLPGGGTLTFEPGGQVEYSSPPCRSPSALLALLRSVVLPLRAAAAGEGITLLAVGIDPTGDADAAPLLLRTKRYERMADYLARRGPAGARMMRQTASFQMALDMDDEPWLRWRVLNAAAPYVTAIFANSPVYDGVDTGGPSVRAQVWRALDPARTGLPWSARDPVGAYLDFALDAPAIMLPAVDGEHWRFGEWLARAEVTLDEWHDHVTTLFPEPELLLEPEATERFPAVTTTVLPAGPASGVNQPLSDGETMVAPLSSAYARVVAARAATAITEAGPTIPTEETRAPRSRKAKGRK